MLMYLEVLAIIGYFTLPIWGIIFCLSLFSFVEKLVKKQMKAKNNLWLTLSLNAIIIVVSSLVVVS